MLTKTLSVAAVALLASLSMANAQIFTTGSLNLDGSNVEQVGPLVYAYNLGDDLTTTTLNGITFVGINQNATPVSDFTITNSGGFDSTTNGVTPADAIYDLQQRGAYNNLTLQLNNLTPGTKYQVQLMIGEQPGDGRVQSYTDGAVTSPTVLGINSPEYISDYFTASGTSETLTANVGGGFGAQLTGFVLEEATPEPSTWALVGFGLAGLAFFGLRRRSALRS